MSRRCRSGLVILILAVLDAYAFAENGSSLMPVPFDSALTQAVHSITMTLEREGVPCTASAVLPVVVWSPWIHRADYSTLCEDRGFGRFLAEHLEGHLPCPTAVRGEERDCIVRELLEQAGPFYDSSDPRFRGAGRHFPRSRYLVTGDWWKTGHGIVTFTIRIYDLLRGEQVPMATTHNRVHITTIPEEEIRRGLASHVTFVVTEAFDSAAAAQLGRDSSPSVIPIAVTDSLARRPTACDVIIVEDTSHSDVIVSGEVRYLACVPTEMMRRIFREHSRYAYHTEAWLRIRWARGRSETWQPQHGHECPRGMADWESDPHAAYLQARAWLLSDGPDRETAVGWAVRLLCAE